MLSFQIEKKRNMRKSMEILQFDEVPDTIGSGALNKWLFNTDTVDKVLEHLMKDGIKVSGGDKLGKTIIFAKNHQHAVFIEERFNKNYPEYSGHFLRVIDNYETKAQDLLEKFTDPFEEQDPQIAVSVDMMDTGVDAPRVVNLCSLKWLKLFQVLADDWKGNKIMPRFIWPWRDKKEFMILTIVKTLNSLMRFLMVLLPKT